MPVLAGALAVALTLPLAACADAQGTWRGEQTRRGDTLIVKTVSGSVWRDTMTLAPEIAIGSADGADALLFGMIGSIDVDATGNIYVLERQANEVRVFSSTGAHLRTFGRKGGGPGEFDRPQGLRVIKDGRVVVRDQARFSVFNASGAYTHGWNLLSNYSTSSPFFMTADLRILSPTFFDGRMVWHRIDGTALDTVRPPQRMPPAPMLEVGGGARYGIRYMPGPAWTVLPSGKFISARTDRYEIDVPREDGTIMRISRDVAPVPVPAAEADRIRDALVRNIKRGNNPAYEWNGPPIPKTKPLIGGIVVGTDGTLWVFRPTPSIERKVDADVAKATGYATEWVSTSSADVFDAQGKYLGAVKFPDGAVSYVLSAARVWGVANHPDGYPQVVRYALRPKR